MVVVSNEDLLTEIQQLRKEVLAFKKETKSISQELSTQAIGPTVSLALKRGSAFYSVITEKYISVDNVVRHLEKLAVSYRVTRKSIKLGPRTLNKVTVWVCKV